MVAVKLTVTTILMVVEVGVIIRLHVCAAIKVAVLEVGAVSIVAQLVAVLAMVVV